MEDAPPAAATVVPGIFFVRAATLEELSNQEIVHTSADYFEEVLIGELCLRTFCQRARQRWLWACTCTVTPPPRAQQPTDEPTAARLAGVCRHMRHAAHLSRAPTAASPGY